jgi:succinate dehydrogenase / fumarate reductase membrane anchor subunit
MLVDLLTRRYPGMRLWLTQRLTALVMAGYIVLLLLLLLVRQPDGYAGWHAFVSPWWLRLATLLVFVCLVMHAWLGIRDVMRDYVRNIVLRGYLQLLMEIMLAIYLIWLAVILWNI